jgi:hypothetical protein
MRPGDARDECPSGCDLTGAPIPEEDLHLYRGATHYSRRICVYVRAADRTVEWVCPDCGVRWPRQ